MPVHSHKDDQPLAGRGCTKLKITSIFLALSWLWNLTLYRLPPNRCEVIRGVMLYTTWIPRQHNLICTLHNLGHFYTKLNPAQFCENYCTAELKRNPYGSTRQKQLRCLAHGKLLFCMKWCYQPHSDHEGNNCKHYSTLCGSIRSQLVLNAY